MRLLLYMAAMEAHLRRDICGLGCPHCRQVLLRSCLVQEEESP